MTLVSKVAVAWHYHNNSESKTNKNKEVKQTISELRLHHKQKGTNYSRHPLMS